MILATTKDGKEIFTLSDLEHATDIILNPILEKYFYVDTVVSANIKYALVGSEISDPIKGANLNMSEDLSVPVTSPLRSTYDKHLSFIQSFNDKTLTDIKLELQKFNSGLTQEIINPVTGEKII
jgi:hypothetical protein